MNWYLSVLKKYAVSSGRARRKEYWMFVLFNMIFAIMAVILDNVLGIAVEEMGYGPLYSIYFLAVLIPGFSVLLRRLHDIGKSGWWFFIGLIPLVGVIWLLVLLCTKGNVGDNQYGADPCRV
jgi:uncharacterized membrane protein YhaH (DUF805 family)